MEPLIDNRGSRAEGCRSRGQYRSSVRPRPTSEIRFFEDALALREAGSSRLGPAPARRFWPRQTARVAPQRWVGPTLRRSAGAVAIHKSCRQRPLEAGEQLMR